MEHKLGPSHSSGCTLEVNVGDSVRIPLSENPTTGFEWSVQQCDEAVIRVESREYQLSSNLCGAGGVVDFVIRAVGAGSGRLVLKYSRSWEKNGDARVFQMNVNVH